MITIEVDTEVLENLRQRRLPGESPNDTIKRVMGLSDDLRPQLEWLTIGDAERC